MKKKLMACWYILTRRRFVLFAYNRDKIGITGAVAVKTRFSRAFGFAVAEILGDEKNYSREE